MKNSNYFPFERNRYFYGKLLSVDDFVLEQRYMNDKRRMVNRFLFGAGVVAGLYVVEVDEQKISVEAGIAFDSWGREIVVDVPVIKMLSFIEGFDRCYSGDAGFMYLCLEYDEEETDQVHNIAGTVSATREQGDLSYNKIKEGYRLFLTDREPEGDTLSPRDLYETTQVIYQEGDILIRQSMPRYIRAGGRAQLKVQVENHGRSNVSFSYSLMLNHLSSDGRAVVNVQFDEILFERTGHYEVIYPIQAAGMAGEKGEAVIDASSVSLHLSGTGREVHIEGEMSASIVEEGADEAVQQEYYRSSMGRLDQAGYRPPVYLAKIYYISATDTYIIDRIENIPFGQYVSNQMMSTALYRIMRQELDVMRQGILGQSRDRVKSSSQGEKREDILFANGVEEIFLEGGGQRGATFFSREIVHGLGLGKVAVILGLETESDHVVYGSPEIFESGTEQDVELAACVNEQNGSFVIGIRILRAVQGKLKIRWNALRDREDVVTEKKERRLFIKPNLLELRVRQSYRLEAVCENMMEDGVLWHVEEEGGHIDEDGRYTAPNTAGVYEVVAQSAAFSEVKASIFVVVREDEEV